MAMRDFHAWLKDTDKKLELPELGENVRRAGVRGYAYPPQYKCGVYSPADDNTHAADAPFYNSLSSSKTPKS